MNKCIGCGIKLQNIDKDKLGYTKNLDNKYCERCFKTIHYNEEKKVNNLDNNEIINKINKLGYFTIFITDLLNINREVINIYKRINNKKILVINKLDIIPNTFKLEHILDNIRNTYNIKEDISFISAKKKYNLNNIINEIEDNKNIIFCGETSSGKSTLINNLIDSNLTTSKYNNTTLDFIKLKYLDYVIYDSPGLIINNIESFDKIDITTRQMNSDYVLDINNIKIRCNGNITIIKNEKCIIKSKKDDSKLEYMYNILDNSDLLIPGYGFIYIKKGIKLESNTKLEIRNSIIGRYL